ncbi:MAG: GNAT family protein [Acutalibacteraceae bacterium]|nr:GNAT family protein [Acutalibacteraceae bacterium]
MKCVLRKWQLSDAKDLAATINNENILNNLRDGIPFPYTEQDGIDFITSLQSKDENCTLEYAIIVDDRPVGSIGIFRRDNIYKKTCELGYYLAQEYWGKGIMTDAVRQICDYVFTHTDIIRIFAEVYADNIGSCRVLEKAGFTLEGIMKNNAIKNGKVLDMKLYALTREP